jgi:hypothetical protein
MASLALMAAEPFNPNMRGFHAVYRDGETNHCPGCGRTHWHIGRISAECAFCATALPLDSSRRGTAQAPIIEHRNKGVN